MKLNEQFFYYYSFADAPTVEETTETSDIQILRSGTFHHRRFGTFTVDQATMDGIIANFEAERIPLDYNHGSLSEDPEKSKSAGWVHALKVIPDGDEVNLMATVKFTEQARGYIENDEFKYISPEFTFNFVDPQTGESGGPKLMAVALTNRPFLPGMLPVTLNDDGWLEEDFEAVLMEKADHLQLTGTDDSLMERVQGVQRGFYQQFKDTEFVQYFIEDIRDGDIIVRRNHQSEGAQLFQIAYAFGDDASTATFDLPESWVKVKKAFVPDRSSTPVAGTDDQQHGRTPLVESSTANSEDGEGIMNEEQLREALGLSEDDDVSAALSSVIEKAGKVDELTADLATLNSDIEALKTAQESTSLTDDDGEDVVKLTEEKDSLEKENLVLSQRIDTLSEDRVALNGRVEALENEGKARDGDALIQLAQSERKLTPAECELAEDGTESEWVRLARDEPNVFTGLIDRKPAFSEDLTKVVASSEGNDEDSTDFWALVDAKQTENLEMKEHDVRALVIAENPAAAEKAGLTVKGA